VINNGVLDTANSAAQVNRTYRAGRCALLKNFKPSEAIYVNSVWSLHFELFFCFALLVMHMLRSF
jgi:hypothetical protein